MSRAYQMDVTIKTCRRDRLDAIQEAAEELWPFEDWSFRDPRDEKSPELVLELRSDAQDNLRAGETEEEFSERLAVAIWRANGQFCPVSVLATFLEAIPCEQYEFNQDAFERLTTRDTCS